MSPTVRRFTVQSLLFVVPLIAYLLFRAQQLPGDSLSFAYDITEHDLFNPHHLLFGFAVFCFWKVVSLIGISDVIIAGQLFNAIWAALGVVFAFKIGQKLFKSTIVALGLATMLFVSHMYWHFATSVEVYVPAMVCSMAAFSVLIDSRPLTRLRLAAFIAWFSLAVLFHQSLALLAVPFGVYMTMKGRATKALTSVLLSAGIILMLYIAAFATTAFPKTVAGFGQYVFNYALTGPADWGTMSNVSWGNVKALCLSQVSNVIQIQSAAGFKTQLLTLTVFALLAWNLIASFRGKKALRVERLCVVLWLVVNYVFLLWWTPGYELLVPLVFPFILLLFFALNDVRVFTRRILSERTTRLAAGLAFAGMLALVLFQNASAFREYKQPSPAKEEADWYSTLADPNTRIIHHYGINSELKFRHRYTRSIDVHRLIGSFYSNTRLRSDLVVDASEDIVLPAWMLNPWFDYNGVNGWSHPMEWTSFFKYVLSITEEADLTAPIPVRHRRFEVVTHPKHPAAVRFLSDTIRSVPAHLLSMLDSAMAANHLPQEAVYGGWHSKMTR